MNQLNIEKDHSIGHVKTMYSSQYSTLVMNVTCSRPKYLMCNTETLVEKNYFLLTHLRSAMCNNVFPPILFLLNHFLHHG